MSTDWKAVYDKLGKAVHHGKSHCPICKGTSWEIGKIYDESKLRYSDPTDQPPEPEDASVVCEQCGYMRTFKITNLLKWDVPVP